MQPAGYIVDPRALVQPMPDQPVEGHVAVAVADIEQRRLPGKRLTPRLAGFGHAASALLAVGVVGRSSGSAGRGAGCSMRASTRLAMNRAVRTGVPLRVTSATSATPRRIVVSTRRPARVATIS